MNIKNNKRGFTLMELLITFAIFAVVVTGMINVLVSAVKVQRQMLADQKMVEEVSYAFEYMTRAIRMAKKDMEGTCVARYANYNYTNGVFSFLNSEGNCQQFKLNNSAIEARISANSSIPTGSFFPITSDAVTVTGLLFNNGGSSWASGGAQSKVTILVEAQSLVGSSSINFQTTVSQRRLNTSYE